MNVSKRATSNRGFTLIELLVVMGIIVLLAAILIPVVSQVRMRSYAAVTQGEMERIMTACQDYYHDFNAYPGPLAQSQLVGNLNAGKPSNPNSTAVLQSPSGAPTLNPAQITSSENLVLGLMGLIDAPTAADGGAKVGLTVNPPPPAHDVVSLNYNRPASYHYMDYVPEELSPGYTFATARGTSLTVVAPTDYNFDASGKQLGETVSDSVIPEFMDHIPDPMAILYLRAYVGVQINPANAGKDIVSPSYNANLPAQYDFSEVAPYGFVHVNPADYPSPAPAYSDPTAVLYYFMNPGILGQPRGKDTFILISAGPDRLYGTKDDIIVTP